MHIYIYYVQVTDESSRTYTLYIQAFELRGPLREEGGAAEGSDQQERLHTGAVTEAQQERAEEAGQPTGAILGQCGYGTCKRMSRRLRFFTKK